MDPRLLRHYDQELQLVREMGAEFATEFPKIAGRLGLEAFECSDPYVERLLEGFAFLAARVQLKLEAEFPTFAQNLLDVVYPHFLAPTPAMAVVELKPDLQGGKFENGYLVSRDTPLYSILGKGEVTACEFRTAHNVTIWPVVLADVQYLIGAAAISAAGLSDFQQDQQSARAAIRLKLTTSGQVPFSTLSLKSLSFFIRGATREASSAILEQVLTNSFGCVLRPPGRPFAWQEFVPRVKTGRRSRDDDEPLNIRQLGLADDEALLPFGPRSFQGYRLLAEYFAFPERFLFFTLDGLAPAIRRATGSELELFILLDRNHKALDRGLSRENFLLNCTPVINLFPKRCDRIKIEDRVSEHHIIPDRTQAIDYEVYQVLSVVGQLKDGGREQEFLPFYARSDLTPASDLGAYYTARRTARILPEKQRRLGGRTNYVGSEVYLSLVDAHEAPYSDTLRQLSVRAMCTNRDLPLLLPLGRGKTDFTVEIGAPLESIRCVTGPTTMKPSRAHGDITWRLISHMSLNYLSIVDNPTGGAAALREMLSLYADPEDVATAKQIDGVKSIASEPIIRRLPGAGSTAIARGLEISVTFDEMAFQGSGSFVLGMVLAEFFRRYVSINSFTETVVKTVDRGEVTRWPMKIGRRHIL